MASKYPTTNAFLVGRGAVEVEVDAKLTAEYQSQGFKLTAEVIGIAYLRKTLDLSLSYSI